MAGCTHRATAVLPAAPLGIPALAQVAAAPLRPCCNAHREVVSNQYATALDWALLKERDVPSHPARGTIQQICHQLRNMDTAWTRSLYRTLECLPHPR